MGLSRAVSLQSTSKFIWKMHCFFLASAIFLWKVSSLPKMAQHSWETTFLQSMQELCLWQKVQYSMHECSSETKKTVWFKKWFFFAWEFRQENMFSPRIFFKKDSRCILWCWGILLHTWLWFFWTETNKNLSRCQCSRYWKQPPWPHFVYGKIWEAQSLSMQPVGIFWNDVQFDRRSCKPPFVQTTIRNMCAYSAPLKSRREIITKASFC